MAVFGMTAGIFALCMLVMAVGVLIAGKRLKGSCGGEGGADCACERFEEGRCERRNKQAQAATSEPQIQGALGRR